MKVFGDCKFATLDLYKNVLRIFVVPGEEEDLEVEVWKRDEKLLGRAAFPLRTTATHTLELRAEGTKVGTLSVAVRMVNADKETAANAVRKKLTRYQNQWKTLLTSSNHQLKFKYRDLARGVFSLLSATHPRVESVLKRILELEDDFVPRPELELAILVELEESESELDTACVARNGIDLKASENGCFLCPVDDLCSDWIRLERRRSSKSPSPLRRVSDVSNSGTETLVSLGKVGAQSLWSHFQGYLIASLPLQGHEQAGHPRDER